MGPIDYSWQAIIRINEEDPSDFSLDSLHKPPVVSDISIH